MHQLRTLFFVLLGVSLCSPVIADTVYLNSGEKIEGHIFREGGINVYMISDTETGLVSRAIPQQDVERIEYSKDPGESNSAAGQDEIVKRYREFQDLYRAGNKSFQKKEYYDAMESYRQAVQLNPNFPQLHYNLGVVYVNLGYSSKAKQCFEDADRLARLITDPDEKEQDLIANIKEALGSLQ